jgi:lysophospholipase L1-like esterase
MIGAGFGQSGGFRGLRPILPRLFMDGGFVWWVWEKDCGMRCGGQKKRFRRSDCQYNQVQNHGGWKCVSKPSGKRVRWAIASAAMTGVLTLGAVLFYGDSLLSLWQRFGLPGGGSLWPGGLFWQGNASSAQTPLPVAPEPELGPRLQLNYDQWVALLHREAQVMAADRPERLAVLAGDSLSLWFPAELLPSEMTWLNQGISGETSAGLLRRLDLFDQTRPQTVFVMVGINDLIRGIGPATVIANTEAMIRHLRRVHPRSRIVVQSILPHGDRAIILEQRADQVTPVWANQILAIPNERIRALNDRLAQLAQNQGVDYLDLHSAFTTADGMLRPDLTTDGLHLSPQGYGVWRSRLATYVRQKGP